MKKNILTIVSLLILAIAMMSNSGGISNANGAPSEGTCNASGCHTGNSVNNGSGTLTITDNIPATGYIPGATYNISVTVSRTGTSLFGFGFEAVSSSNSTAGTLVVTNSAQTRTLSGFRVNMTHQSGAGANANSKTFTFNWIAPTTPSGNITFFAAGNAANNNGNTSGDFIFTNNKVFGPYPVITGSISGSPFCGGSTGVSIPYVASGTFGAGNVFTAEISDASGSFASPTTIGSLTSGATGTIISNLPLPIIAGTGYRIRVNSSNPAVTGLSNTVNLSIIAPPDAALAGPNQNICGSSTTLSANTPSSGTGSWSVISGQGNFGSSSNPSTSIGGLATGTNVLRWTIASTGCASSISNVTVVSNGVPSTASVAPDQTVCANFVNLYGNTPTVGTGSWVLVSGGGSITSPGTPTTNVTNVSVGLNVFAWQISNLPCPVSSASLNVTYNGSITIANAGSDQTLCANSATLNGNLPTAGTGSWSVLSGTGNFASATNPSTTVSGLSTGNNMFRWTISNGPCTPTTDDVTITSNTISSANAGSNRSLCVTGTTLLANNPTNGTGQWSIAAGTASLQNPNSYSTTVNNLSPGANIFVWTISNAPCSATSSTVIITQSGTMSVADAGLDQSVCSSSLNLSPGPVAIGSGNWSLISGSGLIASSSSPNTAVTSLGTGTNVFRWTVSNGTCTPSSDDVAVVVTTISTSNAGPVQTICSNSCILNANTPAIGTGSWSLVSGTGFLSSTTSPITLVGGLGNGVSVFRWTISNAPCPNSVSEVTVNNCTNNAIVTSSISGSPFCGTTSYSVLVPFTYTGTFNGFYTAELSSANGIFFSPIAIGSGAASPIIAFIPASVSTGTAYRIRVKNSSPNIAGTDNGNDLAINTCPVDYFTLPNIYGSPFCPETSLEVIIPFTTTGNVPPAYVAELSDSTGSFATPLTIGYSSVNLIVATIPSGMYSGYNYRIRVRNTSGIISSMSNKLAVNTCSIVGISKQNASEYFVIYPNLTDGLVQIKSAKHVNEMSVHLMNNLGQPLIKKQTGEIQQGEEIQINLAELPAGVYMISIKADGHQVQQKIIKY